MRYLTYYTQDKHRIDIFNSWLGKEDIYHDGNLVSSRRSFRGARHEFDVQEGASTVQYQVNISLRFPQLIGFDIYRNGSALLLF
jgi:hypothetical protein